MVSARTYRRDKMDMLVDAGLTVIQMGVQSGSQRVLDEVFNRPLSIDKTRKVARELGDYEHRHGVTLMLDFIIDNPWETREDVYQTVRYLLDIPPRTLLNVFFLTYFPGTPVYDRAVAEGIIKAFSLRAFRPYTRARLRFQRNWEEVLILSIRLLRMAVRRKNTATDTILRISISRPVRLVMGLLPPRSSPVSRAAYSSFSSPFYDLKSESTGAKWNARRQKRLRKGIRKAADPGL